MLFHLMHEMFMRFMYERVCLSRVRFCLAVVDCHLRALLREPHSNVGWTGVFTFPSIVKLARHFGLIHFTDDEIGLLKDVRNNVSHSDRNLVAQYGDVETLVKAYSMFQQKIERA